MMMLPTVASSSTDAGSVLRALPSWQEQGANPGIRVLQGAAAGQLEDAGVLPFSRFLASRPRDFGHEAGFLQYPSGKAASGQKAGVAY
jgi:hypothetical protein